MFEDESNHLAVIASVLACLNEAAGTPFVLKGGNALIRYGLDRMSNDIDLDAAGRTTDRAKFFELLSDLCDEMGWTMRIGKNTDTVGRALIHYGETDTLKVEVSYRRAEIPSSRVVMVDGVAIYSLDELARMKSAALLARDRARDLYDVCYLCVNYYDVLTEAARDELFEALLQKNLDQFDYLVEMEELKPSGVDFARLEDMLLDSLDIVGIITEPPTRSQSKPIERANNADNHPDRRIGRSR